jgi:hypothetical protein
MAAGRRSSVRKRGGMGVLRKLGVVFIFLMLEGSALFGVPIPPSRIRELMDLMNKPKATHVMRDDAEDK